MASALGRNGFPRPKNLKYPQRNATNCDPRSRTINVGAECGSDEDFYFYMPWRYPGITPITDSCGVAGGVLPGQAKGVAGADYTETPLAKLGDLGSRLPPMPTGTVWTAGGTAEVGWTQKAYAKTVFLSHLYIKTIVLPRQARDKHRETSKTDRFLRWHGGGYQYRLAPAKGPLTEEVFQKMPLVSALAGLLPAVLPCTIAQLLGRARCVLKLPL